MAKWNRKKNASNWWYLAGLVGTFGSLIAIIYVLISESKLRLFSLLYLIGILGPIVVYFVAKDEDHKLADLSKKILIGNILIAIIIILFIVFFFALAFPFMHSFGPHVITGCFNTTNGTRICT